MLTRRGIAALLFLAACGLAVSAPAQTPTEAPALDPSHQQLADALSRLIRDAIPAEYDKQKDWGATAEITTGVRVDDKPFHYHFHARKKNVDHGVWKHYRLRFIEPEKNLAVRVTNLQPLAGGRMGFTLALDATLNAWARAKVYQYGVHLIALEMEGDMRVHLELAGEIGLQATVVNGSPGMAVQPLIRDARLVLEDFRLRRVSNARGPLIRELSDGVRRIAEEEINGPQLTAKLNRAIEKKQDRLIFTAADLIESDWWSLAR